MLTLKPVKLLVKLPVVPDSVVLLFAIVGFVAVFQQIPLAVIVEPPSLLTFPPLIAVVPAIVEAAVVLANVGTARLAVAPIKLTHSVPLYTCNSPFVPQLEHHKTNPAGGDVIAIFSA